VDSAGSFPYALKRDHIAGQELELPGCRHGDRLLTLSEVESAVYKSRYTELLAALKAYDNMQRANGRQYQAVRSAFILRISTSYFKT